MTIFKQVKNKGMTVDDATTQKDLTNVMLNKTDF